MALNVKVGLIGKFDMLKFKNMSKVREKAIQAAPANEVSGEFAINTNAKKLHPDYQRLVIDEVIPHEGAKAKTFVFRRADGEAFPYFRAGQYLSLKLPLEGSFVTRAYSLCSSPKDALKGRAAITVRSNPGGFAADMLLAALKPGDEVIASDPQGFFYYEDLRDAKYVVGLAGGSGITPFLSMAYALRDGAEDFELTLLYGSRDEESILFKKELDEVAAACPKFRVVHVLSDEEKAGYEHGFITAELIKKYAPAGDYSVFMCGPKAMYAFEEGEMKKLGLPKRRYRMEMSGDYLHAADSAGFPAEKKSAEFTLTVDIRGEKQTVPCKAEESLLWAMERAGIKAPSHCRSGECGWCHSRLVSGDVYIPEDADGRRMADKKFGWIHPCCSFPLSDVELCVYPVD